VVRARPLIVGVRVNAAEMARIRRAARLRGISPSALLREIAMAVLDGPDA
jgi:hypothetical protein